MALWFGVLDSLRRGVLDPHGIKRPAARALDVQLLKQSFCQLAIAAGASHFLHRRHSP